MTRSRDPVVAGTANRRGARARPVIEREIKLGGGPEILAATVAVLRAEGATAPDLTPKVVRALGPLALAPPHVVVADLSPSGTVAETIAAALAGSVASLIAHDPGVRLGHDPEAVHKARVATRRLRSDLRTFRSLLDEAWLAELRGELAWIAALLGDVRDADVLAARLARGASRLGPEDAAAAGLLSTHLAEQRDERRRSLLAALDSTRYTSLLDHLVDAARAPRFGADTRPGERADAVVPKLVLRPWRHLAREIDGLGPDADDEALHRVRIRAKRCRYAAEAVGAVAGKRAAGFATAVADLQAVLGDLHDAVVAEAWLRQAASSVPGGSLVAGQLLAGERAAAARARRAWRDAWKRASAPKRRAWIPGA